MVKIGHITDENTFMMCPNFIYLMLQVPKDSKASKILTNQGLLASSIATATATVIKTCGLLPAPDNRRRTSLQARLQTSL